MRRRNTALALLLLVVAILYFLFNQSGYYLSAKRATQQAAAYSGQVGVYNQAFGSDRVVILSNGSQSRAEIVHRKWGFLYKPGTTVEMAALKGRPTVRYAWFSADSSTHDGKRDIIFAAESFDAAVRKVIVSNDTLSAPKDSAEVKRSASVYVELDVAQHYGIAMEALEKKEIGSFVIRAVDGSGRIVAGS